MVTLGGNKNMEKLKYLKRCKDFEILKNNLDYNTLEIIENEIKEYEEVETNDIFIDDEGIHQNKNYEPSFIIQWYNSMITTNELIEVLKLRKNINKV